MKETDMCWQILPKVSRSFALCIRILPHRLNEQMMVSYLIFRILDTIEDSRARLKDKKALFNEAISLMGRGRFDKKSAEKLSKRLLEKLDYTYEKELLENLPSVMAAYFSQEKSVQRRILRWGKVMAKGMYIFQKRKIKTLRDQNTYSYYVAGVIGYLFNDLLLINKIISWRLKRRLRRYAKHFGLALQKVNILRDIASDIASGRYYWPSSLIKKYCLSYSKLCKKEYREAALKVLREQIDDARKYLYSAMKYILLLPKKALRVRMFCLIPLFMAIESYAKCIDNCELFETGKVVKIGRDRVQNIVAKSGLWGKDNDRLIAWFIQTLHSAGPDFVREEYTRSLLALKNR
ncbi:MAG: squalene/phytoene synthase family protein [Candidatus Micrarchaeota archaeon]|nr:squalene/phytoene synthase family protein [Candidatus Micrarchaeota archaeon]